MKIASKLGSILAFLLISGAVAAQPNPGDVFAGKKVTILVGSAAGGGYDAQARLMSRHLGRHIPGNPGVIVQNVPGAGGLVAANSFYSMAPKDGSTIALLQRTALTAKALIVENVLFDVTKMNWLGSLAGEPGVMLVWRDVPVLNAQDLLTREVIVGGAGTANDSEMTPRVLNAVLGTRIKIVSGYKSITDVLLAMERGEVQGVVDLSLSNVKRNPSLVSKDSARVLMQLGLQRDIDLPDIPTPLDFTKTKSDRDLLALYFAPKSVARPVALPPGVPADRLALMRRAFIMMTQDPDLLADADKLFIPIEPVDHLGVEKVIAIVNEASPGDVKRLQGILGGP